MTIPRKNAAAPPHSPWTINVPVFQGSASNTNFNTISSDSGLSVYGGYLLSSGAQNDEVTFNVAIPAGTWAVDLMFAKGTNIGIYTVSIDGVTVGTVDGYNAGGTVRNVVSGITAIALPENGGGTRALKVKMATKNASASAYYGELQHIQLRRTL